MGAAKNLYDSGSNLGCGLFVKDLSVTSVVTCPENVFIVTGYPCTSYQIAIPDLNNAFWKGLHRKFGTQVRMSSARS
eukprot:SAG11_NODE_27701_length_330_cov_0.649351_1_plen_76_part_01